MVFTGAFGKNLDILKRTMDVSVMRRQVIADNIANADTPNFKRSTVTFESELARALASEGSAGGFTPLMTDPRHIVFEQPVDYRTVEPHRVWDYLTTAKNNGNNVDIEVETMSLLENQMLYETMASVLVSEYARVNMVLK